MKQALWKNCFSFSRMERVGILILLALIVICLSMHAIWEHYCPPPELPEEVISEVVQAVPLMIEKTEELFTFDPNTLSEKGWQKLGVAAHNISMIGRYLAKGGRFRKKEDLQRIYGFPPAMYARLAPFIQIVAPEKDTVKPFTHPPQRKTVSIEINEADSATWESLRGIGPVLAARIVRFRDKLGGFYTVSQVKETYGLPESTFVNIQASLRLDKVSLNIIDINEADEQTLAKHPYIRYKIARQIVLYRNNHGPFSRTEQLLGIPLVDDSIYRKIEPYIKTIK